MGNTSDPSKIAVVGSINMDLVLRLARFPRPGETLAARSYQQVSGGKGANQAVALAKAGAAAVMLGRVGDDGYGQRLLESLKSSGVDCSQVLQTSGCESGLAFISVDDQGQNSIVIVGGANGQVTPEDIERFRPTIQASRLLLLQLEIPLPAVLAAMQVAKAAGVPVMLDPAPAPAEFPEELLQVDLLCPNEEEALQLAGISDDRDTELEPEQAFSADSVNHPHDDLLNSRIDPRIETAAIRLHQRGARQVVVTLGAQGALICDSTGTRLIPGFQIEAVDTTAAGDTFAGALAVRWAELNRQTSTNSLDVAVSWANAAGALAASRFGAQPSMASRDEIETFWSSGG